MICFTLDNIQVSLLFSWNIFLLGNWNSERLFDSKACAVFTLHHLRFKHCKILEPNPRESAANRLFPDPPIIHVNYLGMKGLWVFPGCSFLVFNCTSIFKIPFQGLSSSGSLFFLCLSSWIRCLWHVTILLITLHLSTPRDSEVLTPYYPKCGLWTSSINVTCKHVRNTESLLKVKVAQLCLTICDHMDITVRGILQARILEWVAFPFSRGSSQPRDRTQVSHFAGGFFTSWARREAQNLTWDLLNQNIHWRKPLSDMRAFGLRALS